MSVESVMYTCPHCQEMVSLDPAGGEIFTCPTCGRDFSIESPAEGSTRADELDEIRIRQLALERRATYRARSYSIVAAIACGVIVLELVWMSVRHVKALGWGMRPIGYLLFALLSTMGVVYFARRAMDLHREATERPPVPPAQPDFAPLDNGSGRAKRLEDVR